MDDCTALVAGDTTLPHPFAFAFHHSLLPALLGTVLSASFTSADSGRAPELKLPTRVASVVICTCVSTYSSSFAITSTLYSF